MAVRTWTTGFHPEQIVARLPLIGRWLERRRLARLWRARRKPATILIGFMVALGGCVSNLSKFNVVKTRAGSALGFGDAGSVGSGGFAFPDRLLGVADIAGPAEVQAIAVDGSTAYIGGKFTHVGFRTGPGISGQFGQPTFQFGTGWNYAGTRIRDTSIEQPEIMAALSDGAGGWFVGGRFTHIGLVPVTNLAHIFSGGTVDATWTPNPDGLVTALEYDPAGFLLVGGGFSNICGGGSMRLASVTPSGPCTLRPGFTSIVNSNASVTALHVPPGYSEVYVGLTGSLVFSRLERYSSVTGATIAPAPPTPTGSLDAINVIRSFPSGCGAPPCFFVAGKFTLSAPTRYGHLTFDYNSPTANAGFVIPTLQLPAATQVFTVEFDTTASPPRIWIGGNFNATSPSATHLLSYTLTPGVEWTSAPAVDPLWTPSPNAPVKSILRDPITGQLLVAGHFISIAGTTRLKLARMQNSGGAVATVDSGWIGDLDPDGGTNQVNVLAPSPTGSFYIGGKMGLSKVVPRNHLAAVNLATGEPLSWNPNVSGATPRVRNLQVTPNHVYVSGEFNTLAGSASVNFGILTKAPGAATLVGANTGSTPTVYRIKYDPSSRLVYVVGNFNMLMGLTRTSFARVDDSTLGAPALDGASFLWTPATPTIYDVDGDGTWIYLAGNFTQIEGESIPYLVRVNPSDGSRDASWVPNPNGPVFTISLLPQGSVYVGGNYTVIGAGAPATRGRNAIIDLTSAADKGLSFDSDTPAYRSLFAFDRLFMAGTFFILDGAGDYYHLAQIDMPGSPWLGAVNTAFKPSIAGGAAGPGGSNIANLYPVSNGVLVLGSMNSVAIRPDASFEYGGYNGPHAQEGILRWDLATEKLLY